MNKCCHQTNLPQRFARQESHFQHTSRTENQLVQDNFLSGSYFIMMLLMLGAFPVLLKTSRLSGDSTLLFATGCAGIMTLIFSVVSFLYYSETQSVLKQRFAKMRNLVLSAFPLIFWWAFHLNLINADTSVNSIANSFEWTVIFGLSTSLILLFMSLALKPTQKELLTSYLFLTAALCVYTGVILDAVSWSPLSDTGELAGSLFATGLLIVAGALGLLGFMLQTQSKFRNKCQNVEMLLLLSFVVQIGTLLSFSV